MFSYVVAIGTRLRQTTGARARAATAGEAVWGHTKQAVLGAATTRSAARSQGAGARARGARRRAAEVVHLHVARARTTAADTVVVCRRHHAPSLSRRALAPDATRAARRR